MKIALAQTSSLKGDIAANIADHLVFIETAVIHGANAVFFPELSITGYEPTLAAELATTVDDSRLSVFQQQSNLHKIIIGVGLPVKSSRGISISMVLFQPFVSSVLYSKKYIHADEEPFFIHGENPPGLILGNYQIALAICYEITIPEHAAQAHKDGAGIYIASVVKTPDGANKAIGQLSAIAKKYTMTVLMCNAVGIADGGTCGGQSSVWNNQGELLGHLSAESEGILMLDTNTNEIEKY